MSDLLSHLRTTFNGRYWGLIGIEFIEAEPGRAVCRVKLRPEHFNYNDVVHGGVVSGMLDAIVGAAVETNRTLEEVRAKPHATTDLHVSYLRGGIGTELIGEGRVSKAGRTAVFTEGTISDDQGREVARGLATFVISSRASPR